MRLAMLMLTSLLIAGCNDNTLPSNVAMADVPTDVADTTFADQNTLVAQGGPDQAKADGREAAAKPIDADSSAPTVKIKGSLTYRGSAEGPMLVDIMKAGAEKPTVLYNLALDKAGAFETTAPLDLGEVIIVAYLDKDENGPSKGDPAGKSRVFTLGSDTISDINIILRDGVDLGKYKPWDAPRFLGPEDPGAAAADPGDAEAEPSDVEADPSAAEGK